MKISKLVLIPTENIEISKYIKLADDKFNVRKMLSNDF